jgi:CRP-like cAMP-binding protein
MKRPVAPPTQLAPAINAIPFLKGGSATRTQILTDRQREELARIGTRLRLPARMVIYREEVSADWVFVVSEGVVKSYKDLPSGKRVVGAFLFPRDLFGLAENGKYVATTQAVTRVALYRLPIDALTELLMHDPQLQFQFLAKVTHELRDSQRRAILINRRDAVGRLAMFITLMRQHAPRETEGDDLEVPLPMSRSDIANYLGLSLESVSRAAAELERRGIVKFEGRTLARIADSGRLARLSAAV